jgi:hypothetical protein
LIKFGLLSIFFKKSYFLKIQNGQKVQFGGFFENQKIIFGKTAE